MKKMSLALITVLFLSLQVKGDEIIRKWKFNSPNDLKLIQFSFHGAQNKFSWSIDEKEKTPDGENSLLVTIIKSRPKAVSYEKQINFCCKYALEKKQKYRIEFWCKSSHKGNISLTAAQAEKPYKVVGNPAKVNKTIELSPKWKKVTLDFYPIQNFDCKIAVPRLMLAHFPAGYNIYFGPITFSKISQ